MTGGRASRFPRPALLVAVLAACACVAPMRALAAGAGSEAGLAGVAHASPLGGVTLDQAVEMAERRYRARVVRASREDAEGRRIYVLRLLSEQGRVWTIRIDADTGREF